MTANAVSSRLRPSAVTQSRLLHEAGIWSLLLLEIAWVVPWFRSLTPVILETSTVEAIALLLGTAGTTRLAARLCRRLSLKSAVRVVVLLVLLLAWEVAALRLIAFRGLPIGLGELVVRSVTSFQDVLTLLPNELIVVLTTLYVWRHGVVTARTAYMDAATTTYRFRLGILGLVAFAVVHRGGRAPLLLEVLPLYFGSGLLAVGLSRADQMSSQRRSGRSPFTLEWMGSLVLLTAATVGAGLAGGAVLSSRMVQSLAQELAALTLRLLGGLLRVLSPVIMTMVYLADRLAGFLRETLGLERVLLNWRRALPSAPPAPPEPLGGGLEWLTPYLPGLKIAATVLILLVLALLVIRGRRSGAGAEAEPLPMASEDLLSWRSLVDGLRRAFDPRRGLATLRRGPRLWRRFLTAQVIRRIYTLLLEAGADMGRARRPSETPSEYLVSLRRLFPDRQQEVAEITAAYIDVRYGEIPEHPEALEQVRRCWETVRGDLRRRPREAQHG